MNSTKKHSLFLVVSVLLVSLGCAEIAARYYIDTKVEGFKAEALKKEKVPDDIKHFITRYSDRLHHLRSPYNLPMTAKPSDIIFQEIRAYAKNRFENVLLQGDLWADQALHARDYIHELTECKNIGFIFAGISSYSPTPMAIQLDILRSVLNWVSDQNEPTYPGRQLAYRFKKISRLTSDS